MSADQHDHPPGNVTPAQGRPAMSDTEPAPDTQVGFGDDAAGAVGSSAPLEEDFQPTDEDPADRRRGG